MKTSFLTLPLLNLLYKIADFRDLLQLKVLLLQVLLTKNLKKKLFTRVRGGRKYWCKRNYFSTRSYSFCFSAYAQKDEPVLIHIKNLFGVGSVQKTSDPGVFRYSIVSFKSNSVIVDYFLSYPPSALSQQVEARVKGKKQSAFIKWKFICELLLEKKHLEAGGIDKIREMAISINNE